MEVANDDLDEDIERLQIILQNDDDHESDGELVEIDRLDDEFISNPSRPSTSSDFTASSFPTTSVCTDGDDLTTRLDPNTVTAETCLAMNRAYQEVLLDTLRQIEMSLFENRACQKQLEESIEDSNCKKSIPTTETKYFYPCISKALPYFKDENGELPPPNPDVKLKDSMNEAKQQIRPKGGWSKKQRKALLDAVKLDALEQLIRPALSKVELEMEKLEKCKTKEEIDECKNRIKALKQDVELKQNTPADELLKTVDSSKIDFLKIAALNFDCKFNADECESMWKNVLHPGINRNKWTPEENDHLIELVKKHQMRNWQQIADELGTHRTPYQCLQHFQHNNIIHDDSEWTEDEDQMLKEIIDSFCGGNSKIQWHQVAYYMDNRSVAQCRSRWCQIDPYRKVGRWSKQEDDKLLNAVRKTGMDLDWNKVADLVPNRSGPQCRERYLNRLRDMQGGKLWTYEEDKQLLMLHLQYGNNWTLISEHLVRRPELSIKSRYKRLMRWKDEMEQFESYPAKVQETKLHDAFEFYDNGKIRVKSGLIRNHGCKMLGRPLGFKNFKSVKKSEGERLRQAAGGLLSDDEDDQETSQSSKVTKETTTKDKSGKMSIKEKQRIQNDLDLFIGYYNIDGNDYFRQQEDISAGNLVVPRPVPLKDFKSKKMPSIWKKRTALMEVVQSQIDIYLNKIQSGTVECDNSEGTNNLYDEISKVIKMEEGSEEEKRKLILSAFGGRNPSELKVKELLDISRSIKENGRLPSKTKDDVWKPADSDDDDFNDDLLNDDDDDDANNDDYYNDEDDDDDDDNDDDGEEDDTNKAKKMRKPLSDRQKTRIRKLHIKNSFHGNLHHHLKQIVELKMDYSEFNNPGRKRKFSIYPQNILLKYKGMFEDVKLNKSSTALLLKALDVDSKKAYVRAYKGNRTIKELEKLKTAEKRSNLKRAKTRRQKDEILQESQKEANITSEFREAADCILDLGEELGITDDEIETMEENDDHFNVTGKPSTPEGTSNSTTESSEEKSLPYLPPNKTTLKGLRGLLTEHRKLIDQSEKYFNPEELRDKLYRLKEKGPNPFMGVLNAVGKTEMACRRKGRHNPRKNYQVTASSQHCLQQLQEARKSPAYQQLKARFLSMFSWPALLSTIQPPKSTALPRKLRDIAIKNSVDNIEQFYKRVKKNRNSSVLDRIKLRDNDNDDGDDDDDDDDDAIVPPDENLTEEEAIEKLVETIMKEYEENRSSKCGYRKKNRDKYLKKERTEILKKLGLYEKMQELKRQRESSLTVTMETTVTKEPTKTTVSGNNQPINVDNTAVHDILLPTIGPSVKGEAKEIVTIQDDSTKTNESPSEPVKRSKGRPKGSKTKILHLDESEMRKSTRTKTPRHDDDIIRSPAKKNTRNGNYGNYSHLKKLIPKKLNIISHIPEIPLLNESDTSTVVTDKTETKSKTVKSATPSEVKKKIVEKVGKKKIVGSVDKQNVVEKPDEEKVMENGNKQKGVEKVGQKKVVGKVGKKGKITEMESKNGKDPEIHLTQDTKRKRTINKNFTDDKIYAKKQKLENAVHLSNAAWQRGEMEKVEERLNERNKRMEEMARKKLTEEIMLEFEENGFADDEVEEMKAEDNEADDNKEITLKVIDNKGTLVQVKNYNRTEPVAMGTKHLEGAEALVALGRNTVDTVSASHAVNSGNLQYVGTLKGDHFAKVNDQGATNNVKTVENATTDSKEQAMFIGVPVIRDGVTKVAYLPFRPDKDGKITLPDGRKVDVSVHDDKSSVSINIPTSKS